MAGPVVSLLLLLALSGCVQTFALQLTEMEGLTQRDDSYFIEAEGVEYQVFEDPKVETVWFLNLDTREGQWNDPRLPCKQKSGF
jgi:hypothetical protein